MSATARESHGKQSKACDNMEQKASVTPNPSPTNREGGLQTVLPTLARLFRTEILVLLLIFAVFNFFKLSNFFIAIDDDFEVFRSNGFNWILTGRWASYLFLRYLTPQPILPFFPTFIFGLGLALSYPLLLSCFGVRRLSAVHYLAFPLYAGFPTWMYLTSLTAASCWAGVAQLFVVMAVHRFHAILGVLDSDSSRSRSWFAMQGLLCGLALAIALGFYQAFVATYVVLGLAVLLVRHRSSPIPFWRVTRHSLALGGSTILGIILYEIIDYGFRHIFGIFSTSYLTEFLNLHALFESPLGVLGRSFLFGGAIYAGHTPIYATDSFSFPVILASGLAAIALWRGRSGNARIVAIMLAGGILLVPIVQPLLNGGGMPLRTLVAVPSVFWLFGMLGLTSEVRTIALIALAAVTIGLLQVLYASGLYFAAGHFARIHDQQLAAAVYARIADVNPELESTKTYSVDFFGARPFQTHYPRPPSSTAGYSFFEWDGGNEERILDYMRLIGYTNLRAPSPQQRKQDLAIFQQMPVWPARNSVRVAGDVTLIKLGPTPGYPFNTQ